MEVLDQRDDLTQTSATRLHFTEEKHFMRDNKHSGTPSLNYTYQKRSHGNPKSEEGSRGLYAHQARGVSPRDILNNPNEFG